MRDITPAPPPVSDETRATQDEIIDWIRRNLTDETQAYSVICVAGTPDNATVDYKNTATPNTINRVALADIAYRSIREKQSANTVDHSVPQPAITYGDYDA